MKWVVIFFVIVIIFLILCYKFIIKMLIEKLCVIFFAVD